MDINLIENIIKELQNKGKIDNKEELETLITDLHRVKNDISDLQNKNEELNNRFGLFWKEVPEKMIKNISDNEIVYGKSLYSFITKIKNGEGKTIKANINGKEIKLSRQADSYLFKDSDKNEFLVFSDSLYKFSKETQEEYIPVLKEKGGDFFIGNNEDNILIEGDNYYALQMLQYTHKGKIDVIYIDPPYNTGKNDFKYNDKFIKDEDGNKHSAWLSFIEKRLVLAKNLLAKDGVIFLSIDDNEVFNLKLLMDNVFNEKNFIGNFAVENNPKGRKNNPCISKSHEYCLIYTNDINKFGKSFDKKEFNKINNVNDKRKIQFDENGEFKKGKRQIIGKNSNPLATTNPKRAFTIYYNKDKNEILLKNEYNIEKDCFDSINLGKEWKRYLPYNKNQNKPNIVTYSESKIIELFNCNNLMFLDDCIYEKERENNLQIKSLLTSENTGYNILTETASRNFKADYPNINFSFPKPLGFLKLLFKISTEKNDTILDFFAGSGSSGEAIWNLNKEDGGNRKFILCTNNENNICEDVTFERLKRANEKYEYNESLKYLTINHLSEKVLRKEDNQGQFETLKEIVNLKYNSFKVIEENDKCYANENIAILKDFYYIEEFKEKFENHEYLGFVTNEDTEWNIFKEKLISVKKEDYLTQFSSSYMNEIRKLIKGNS